jgi:hypothetical protein
MTEQNSPAVRAPLDAAVVPRWWNCDKHGEALPHNAWGCPECVNELRDEVRKLRAFANAVIGGWPDEVCIDGFEFQNHAVKHGLLALKDPRPTAPCGESCNCVEYYGSDAADWAQGVDCYVKTALLGHSD